LPDERDQYSGSQGCLGTFIALGNTAQSRSSRDQGLAPPKYLVSSESRLAAGAQTGFSRGVASRRLHNLLLSPEKATRQVHDGLFADFRLLASGARLCSTRSPDLPPARLLVYAEMRTCQRRNWLSGRNSAFPAGKTCFAAENADLHLPATDVPFHGYICWRGSRLIFERPLAPPAQPLVRAN
jgi:hypothetical protein